MKTALYPGGAQSTSQLHQPRSLEQHPPPLTLLLLVRRGPNHGHGEAGGVLTGVPGQGIVGPSAGEAKALGDLAGAAWPRQQLGWLDLSAELGADDAQQHDGRGLLAPLLVGCGHLLGLGEPGQAAWSRERCTEERWMLYCKRCFSEKNEKGRSTSCVSVTTVEMIPFTSKNPQTNQNIPSKPAKNSQQKEPPENSPVSRLVCSVVEGPWNSKLIFGLFLVHSQLASQIFLGFAMMGFFLRYDIKASF